MFDTETTKNQLHNQQMKQQNQRFRSGCGKRSSGACLSRLARRAERGVSVGTRDGVAAGASVFSLFTT